MLFILVGINMQMYLKLRQILMLLDANSKAHN